MGRRDRAALLACPIILFGSCTIQEVFSPRWATDLRSDSVGSKLESGRALPLDEHSDSNNASNALWIELTLHSNKSDGFRNYRVEGWWGIGQEGAGGSERARLQFCIPNRLRCPSLKRFVNIFVLTSGYRVVNNSPRSCPSGGFASGRRILQFPSFSISFDSKNTNLGRVAIETNNFIGKEYGRSGKLRLPILIELKSGIHIAKGFSQLNLQGCGELFNRALMIDSSGSDPVLKIVFDIDFCLSKSNWTDASHAAK